MQLTGTERGLRFLQVSHNGAISPAEPAGREGGTIYDGVGMSQERTQALLHELFATPHLRNTRRILQLST